MSDFERCGGQPRMMIVTTVPETLATILGGQPAFLSQYFDMHLVTSPGPMFEQVVSQEGLTPEPVTMRRGISPVADLRSIFSMMRVIRRVRPQIIHSYTPKAGLVAMLAAWLCRVPVRVHTFTGLIFPTARGRRQRLLLAVDRLICRAATHVVPEGQGVKHDLERFNVTDKPLAVIGKGNIAGVDCDYFSPGHADVAAAASMLREQLAIGADTFVFCYVGRLNADKGLRELALAFERLPDHARLLVVGGLDESSPPDQDTLARLENNRRVHLSGFQSDIRAALSLSQVLVLPSYREGFPNVVLQAGAMGLPVIATDISGCNEVIKPGKNGWLVPVRDAQALFLAMREALSCPEDKRSNMGRLARQTVQQDFSRPEHWQRMLLFYRSLPGLAEGGA